jgi:hypothetical protein
LTSVVRSSSAFFEITLFDREVYPADPQGGSLTVTS